MIREYKESDIPYIVELEMSTLGETLGTQMLQADLNNPIQKCFVYENDNKILGYISCVFDGYAVEILNFCVQLDSQNQRLGTKILDYILNYYYALGATNVILDVRKSNDRAIHVYEKFGFKKISVRKQYYKNNEDAIVYQKIWNPIEDIEDSYLQVFCEFEDTAEYTRIFDLNNPTKYYHNFTRIKQADEATIQKILSESHGKNFIQINSKTALDMPILNDLKVEHNAIYHANIAGLNISSRNDGICFCATENKELVYQLLFENNKEYGKSYAHANAEQLIDAALNKKKITICIISDKQGNYIGSLHVFLYKDCARLEDFEILASYQKKGYGTQLLAYTLDYLRQQGCYDIILCADEEDTPRQMYQRLGFYKCMDCYIYRKHFK